MKEFPVKKLHGLIRNLFYLSARDDDELFNYALTNNWGEAGELFVFLLRFGRGWQPILTVPRFQIELIYRRYGVSLDKLLQRIRKNLNTQINC